MPNKSKPGDEGLPYVNPAKVLGAEPDNQPKAGLGQSHEVKGGKSVKGPVKGKSLK